MEGLVEFIHAHWGGRSDLDETLDEETVKLVNDNYTAFGCRRINDDVHDDWYFDRNGMFGNLCFDQDELDYNTWKIDTPCDVLPPDDFVLDAAQRRAHVFRRIAIYSEPQDIVPGMTLGELIEDQFAAIVASILPETD